MIQSFISITNNDGVFVIIKKDCIKSISLQDVNVIVDYTDYTRELFEHDNQEDAWELMSLLETELTTI